MYTLYELFYHLDTLYMTKEIETKSKYIAVVYQEHHPYSGYVSYLKEFLPVIGGTLIELPPLDVGHSTMPQSFVDKLLEYFNEDSETINLVILADPATTESILQDISDNYNYDMDLKPRIMELYNFNYYTSDITTSYFADYLSYYNAKYKINPALEDLVFYKLHVLFEVFLNGYTKTLSDAVPNLFYVLYDNTIDVNISSNNDTISVFVSHINTISTDVYISANTGDGSSSIETLHTIKRDELFTYNYYYGRPRKITCSFQSPKVKDVKQYDIALLAYVTGPYAEKDTYITETVIQALREIMNVLFIIYYYFSSIILELKYYQC